MEGFSVTKTEILSGLLEYLDSKPGVKEVSLIKGIPASISQIQSWEKSKGCSLPEDLKVFFLTNNGLTLTWTYFYNGKNHPLGRINVNGLDELLPLSGQAQPILFSQSGSVTSARQPSLSCLDIPSTPGSPCSWTPKFGGPCKIFTLDYCSSYGHVCLIYDGEQTFTDRNVSCVSGELWLLDLSLSWHFLSSTFSDYFRLAVVHLGLTQWPYVLTRHGLSPQCERWFRMLIPKRLEMDLTKVCPASTQDNTPASVVDISKIVVMKPSKEKRSKADAKLPSGSKKLL